jgi:pyruvate dehydrogenase E2 component (dihydrolipoyllysine-residue acetyltransferase)
LASEVIMPALEMAQDFGKLLNWRISEGEQITKGEPLMDIETDKVTVEIEAPASGTLARVTAAPGDLIPVGQVIAIILAPGETAGEGFSEPDRPNPSPATSPETGSDEPAPASEVLVRASPLAARIATDNNVDLQQIVPAGPRIEKSDVLAFLEARKSGSSKDDGALLPPASPKARRLAKERELNIDKIKGTGPGGAVIAGDVMAASVELNPADAIPIPTSSPQTSSAAISNVWRVMAERVTLSWTTVPHFYLMREVNASRLRDWRDSAAGRFEEKLTYTDMLIRIVAATLQRHPRVNASWKEGEIQLNQEINLGLAVAVEEGLIVPIIYQANSLTLPEIINRRQEIVRRARERKLLPDDIRGGTFTISNLGMFGVDIFNAIVNPPQAAILAVGRIADRVVAQAGQPAVQPMLTLSLSCDHRVVDGALGAQFLATLAELLEDPLRLLE